ncbi:MAG: Uma2 family endonuclease [Caldilineaceae bacterium]|nr:Uma2 family endonuclease [Caldilineaceae bacterium]
MQSVKAMLTFADYLETSDDERYELLNGELILSPSPKEIHQYISSVLHILIGTFAREHNLGRVYFSPFDVVLSDTNVVQPDLLFVSNERTQIITPDNIRGAPDLVVEILSPSTAELDRTTKLELYARHGVREYWIVDPSAKTIMVLVLGLDRFEVGGIYGIGHILRSPTLEGFRLPMEELFEASLET